MDVGIDLLLIDKKLHVNNKMKTFLTAIYCCMRCILYPETKIVVSAGKISQGIEILTKIQELLPNSPNLQRELIIKEFKTNQQNAGCKFKNGSYIRIMASNQNSRGARANLLIVDEFRLVDKDVLDSVLRKFKSAPRQPKYLNKPEYAHLQESNKEIYLSSAWLKSHWSWDKVNDFFESMTNGKSYFVCNLPYQMAIKEGLLMRDQVENEMSESTWDSVKWSMEMEGLFFGESEKAFFKLGDLNDNRVLAKPMYPKEYAELIKDRDFQKHTITPKEDGEIRLISCDISVMGSSKKNNDASIYTIMRLIPNEKKTYFNKYVPYMESCEGGNTQLQALRIRQLYEEFDCDYIVLDTNGIGAGVYSALATNLYDTVNDKEYPAFSCINDETMADLCLVEDAEKVIYSIKADAKLNNDKDVWTREDFKQGKLRLLINEFEGKEVLKELKGFKDLPLEDQAKLQLPYLQTTLLVNELINLERVETGNNYIKLKEPSGKRKDRYSSLTYAVWVAKLLEKELKPKNDNIDISKLFKFRKQRIK